MKVQKLLMVLTTLVGVTALTKLDLAAAQSVGTLRSPTDDALTIKTIAVLPVTDNIDGIYARPVQERLLNVLRNRHAWSLIESNLAGISQSLAEMDENPTQVQKIAENLGVDALVASSVVRGPSGTQLTISMYLKTDGLLLLQEAYNGSVQMDTTELQKRTDETLTKLIDRLPYQGMVLSRMGQRVTISLGSTDGIKAGDSVTAVLITNLRRHPKLSFMVSAEREVIGRIVIDKADPTLSFGHITSERSRDVLAAGNKLISNRGVQYDSAGLVGRTNENVDQVLQERPDESDPSRDVGDQQEWLPTTPPTFGKVGLRLGFGSYRYNTDPSGVGGLTASTIFYPSIGLLGELWMTPNWIMATNIYQGVTSVKNPRSGSTPSELNVSTNRFDLSVGYNFLFRNEFFGPRVQVSGGYMRYATQVDSSSPLALTSTGYSGFLLGLKGALPIDDKGIWEIGGGLSLFLGTQLQETPVSSGGLPIIA